MIEERNNRLGLDEFCETLQDLISPMILTQTYIGTYTEFCNHLFFKLWQDYYNSDRDVRHYSRMVDIFFGNLFSFPSSSEIGEEIMDVD